MHRCSLALALLTAVAAAQSESFEKMKVGALMEKGGPRHGRTGALGTWTGGHAEISTRRAKTGAQALRILGGKQRVVVLRRRSAAPGILTFWAERWTRRAPFELRVAAQKGPDWKLVYRDTGKQIVVGGYHAKVQVAIPFAFRALRIECTSPASSGVLLDDFAIVRPQPMRITQVTTEQPILPVLVDRDRNPLLRVRVDTVGHLQPPQLSALRFRLISSQGDELPEIAGVSVFHSTTTAFPERSTAVQFGTIQTPDQELSIHGTRVLEPGANYFWLSVSLHADKVDLDGYLDASCSLITTSVGKKAPAVQDPPGRQRLARGLRHRGDDGVHTYRIPGITTTDQGTLIGVYDIRRRNGSDLPGDIDIGMSRSTDGGRSWEPMRVILDTGDDPAFRYDGIGDPAILFDTENKTTWVAATWSHGNRSWRGSGPGFSPAETGQLMLTKSPDDGKTWSKPINITRQVKQKDWCFVLASPGRGITMADGTLVFGAQYQDTPARGRLPHSTILWSKDRGETWHLGTGARPNTTECQPVEVAPGRILLNMRDNRSGLRSILVTDDLGKTWQPHPTDRKSLVGPTCNAGLLKVRAAEHGKPAWFVFVNPAVNEPPRRQMTVKLSTDGGLSWPTSQQLLIDAGRSAGYASATRIDADTIGLLYEGSRAHLVFQRLKLSALR